MCIVSLNRFTRDGPEVRGWDCRSPSVWSSSTEARSRPATPQAAAVRLRLRCRFPRRRRSMQRRLLIVDDDSDVRLAIRRFLEIKGFKVTEADTCAAAEGMFRT